MKLKKETIQYVGEAGISNCCMDVVFRYIQCGDRVQAVKILTSENHHALLLRVNDRHDVVVKSGFSSGYPGEGPKSFSCVLQLLSMVRAEIEEIEIDQRVLDRLNSSALSDRDLLTISNAEPLRPLRWYDYILDVHRKDEGALWKMFPRVIPWAIIDDRLLDLALSFENGPDDALITGYRRLEDIVRNRIGKNGHGAGLFTQAFDPKSSCLYWAGVGDAEHNGRMSMFKAVYSSYRNPRAHKEVGDNNEQELSEFMVLNELYRLERSAKDHTSS